MSPPCSVGGCSNTCEKGGRGYCGMHAQRVRRYGDPDYVMPDAFRRVNMRLAQLARVSDVKPTTYRKLFGHHEHRAVMEAHLGRRLRSTEIVHHIDGDSHNNLLENLRIVTPEQHGRLHADDARKQFSPRRAAAARRRCL